MVKIPQNCPLNYNSNIDLEYTVSSGVIQPWVVIGTSHASLKVDGFSGNLFGGEFAAVRYPTGGVSFDNALFPPWFEILGFCDGPWVLDPLNYLSHSYEVNIIVIGQNFVNPIQESVQELGVILQPSGVEIKTQGSTILFIMTIKVVV